MLSSRCSDYDCEQDGIEADILHHRYILHHRWPLGEQNGSFPGQSVPTGAVPNILGWRSGGLADWQLTPIRDALMRIPATRRLELAIYSPQIP
jgi:hypothetical protein